MSTKRANQIIASIKKDASLPLASSDPSPRQEVVQVDKQEVVQVDKQEVVQVDKQEVVQVDKQEGVPSITPVLASPLASPTPSPSAAEVEMEQALVQWAKTPQGVTLLQMGNINPNMLAAVIKARVTAAFRAGFSAGVDHGI